MRRREFLCAAGAAVAWPIAVSAQQAGKLTRIGIIGPALNNPANISYYQAFLTRMRELGFREGQHFVVEYKAVDDPRGAFVSASELLRTQPELIVASGPEVALQAVFGASGYVPIVMLAINFDPIERGYVASLVRPGGNITGVFTRSLELAAKQLELLTQAFAERTRIAMLFDELTASQFTAAELTARSLNLQIQPLKLEIPSYDFETAFQSAAAGRAQMVLVLSSPAFVQHRERLAQLAIKHRLPTMFTFKHYAQAGGLMSYGVGLTPTYHRAADYVSKILQGAKPADLPIEQAENLELVVNLKTAKALGIEVPTGILLRANEVIE
jgi:putative tryptophan/tyrosine transport system substrate-binding protein